MKSYPVPPFSRLREREPSYFVTVREAGTGFVVAADLCNGLDAVRRLVASAKDCWPRSVLEVDGTQPQHLLAGDQL